MDYASSLLGLLPGGRRTPGLKELLGAVGDYLPAEQVGRIREAAEFGTSVHKGQKRLSGEPFIAHPVAAAAILAFALDCWAAAMVARASGHKDPGFIVVDEVAAQFLVLLAAPLNWRGYGAAFLLFRVFDIVKPWPVRAIERRVAGGLGIMLDDIAAALYAILLLLIGEGVFGVRP